MVSSQGAIPWLEASRSGGVVLAMNFQGEGQVAMDGELVRRIRPGSLVWLRDVAPGMSGALRLPGERHECLSLFFGDGWLREKLGGWRDQVPDRLRGLLLEPNGKPQWVMGSLAPEDRTWARSLMAPHLCDGARLILEGARMAEFFVRKVFQAAEEPETVVSRTQRAARERVARVREVLEREYESPPPLVDLARVARCNPHYLSRTFTAVEGLTISAFIRRVRVERAAELIASGRCNVSEAAIEVGYQSVAHFTRAFAHIKGVVPSQWVATLKER